MDKYCFIHIPRTAGTSFIHDINKLFTDKFCPYNNLKDYVFSQELDKWDLYGGHTDYRIKHLLDLRYSNVRYMTFIGEPVNRLISHYLHAKRNARHPYRDLLINTTVDEAIEIPELRFELWNHQVKVLTKDVFHINTSTRVKLAKVRLEDMWFFGIKERYQESVNYFEKKIGTELPEIKQGKVRQHLLQLSDPSLSKLQNAVRLDIELYNFAIELFDGRIK